MRFLPHRTATITEPPPPTSGRRWPTTAEAGPHPMPRPRPEPGADVRRRPGTDPTTGADPQAVERRRDRTIDRLRGLCLVSMTVGHLAFAGSAPSPLDKLVHLMLWVSGASGFVFLSGVSVALYCRSRGGPGPATRRWVAARGAVLAVLAVALNLIGIGWFALVGRPAWYPAGEPDLVSLATGRWWLPSTDVLVLYAVFLVVLAAAGSWPARAPRRTLALSATVYGAATLLPDVGPTAHPADRPVWDLPAWQLVFFWGLVAGLHWRAVTGWLSAHRRAVLAAGGIGLTTILGLRLALRLAQAGLDPFGLTDFEAGPLGWLLDKQSLGPLRLLLIALVGPAAYLLAQRRLPLDRLLTGAGARSLRVYVASTLLMFVWPLVTSGPLLITELELMAGTALVLTVGLAPPVGRGRPWSF